MSSNNIFYVTGNTENDFSNFDITTLAINPNGSIKWKKTFSTNLDDYSYEVPVKIILDFMENIIIAGQHISNPD